MQEKRVSVLKYSEADRSDETLYGKWVDTIQIRYQARAVVILDDGRVRDYPVEYLEVLPG